MATRRSLSEQSVRAMWDDPRVRGARVALIGRVADLVPRVVVRPDVRETEDIPQGWRILLRAGVLHNVFGNPKTQLQCAADDRGAMTAGTPNVRHRRDWVLLLLALRDASEPLDPVRLHVGMFVLAQSAPLPSEMSYDFELVDSAPFSSALQDDLFALEDQGMIVRHLVAGYTWSEFTATYAGVQHAQSLANGMTEAELDALRRLDELKQETLKLGFRDLLEWVARSCALPARKNVLN